MGRYSERVQVLINHAQGNATNLVSQLVRRPSDPSRGVFASRNTMNRHFQLKVEHQKHTKQLHCEVPC